MTRERRIALHEAGHAVLALSSDIGVEQMTIDANGGNCWISSIDKAKLPRQYGVAVDLGGIMAEVLAGLAVDCRIADYGGDMRSVQRSTSPRLRGAVISWAADYALRQLRQYWPALQRIAKALEEKGALTGDEVRQLFKPRKAVLTVQLQNQQPKPKRRKRPVLKIDPTLFAPKFSSVKGNGAVRVKARV